LDWGSLLVLTLLGLYSHIEAITPKGAPAWHYVYGGLLIAVAVIGAFGRSRAGIPNMSVLALLAIAVVGVPTAMQQSFFYPSFFFGDIAKVLAPVIFWWTGKRWPQLFTSEKSIQYLFWWLVSAAICAPFYSSMLAPYADQLMMTTDERGRYDPPHPVAIAILWFYVLHRPSFVHFTLLLICSALALFSQQRTNLLIIPILGIAGVALEWRHLTDAARRLHFWLAVASTLCVVAAAALLPVFAHSYRDAAQEVLFYTRFGRFEEGLDESGTNRLLEAKDVISELNDHGPLAWTIGLGHGATFTPSEANSEPNRTPEGVIHHVHIGLQQVLLRYGIVGAALVSLYAGLRMITFLRMRLPECSGSSAERVWLLSLIGVGITFTVFGQLQDPLFAVAVAASLVQADKRGRAEPSHRA